MGEKQNRLFQLSLNASLKVGLKGSRVSSEDLLGQQGLRRWNECGKGGEPSTRGYILWWLGKQNGKSDHEEYGFVENLPRIV